MSISYAGPNKAPAVADGVESRLGELDDIVKAIKNRERGSSADSQS
jgi:hypothetical protein